MSMLDPMPEELGVQRTVRRFAWWPTRLDGGEWVHLRWYEVDEVLEPDYWASAVWMPRRRRRLDE